MANVFPSITAAPPNIYSQLPYGEQDDWLTACSQLESGPTYCLTQSFDAAGDPAVLKRFTVSFPVITPAELARLEDFFKSMRGRLGLFQFTDSQGTVWDNCRFDVDRLDARYAEPGSVSVTFDIAAEAHTLPSSSY